MKVAELREKLSKLDKEEVAKLAVEFYKLIPKSKKEDYNIDELISNPKKSKADSKKIDETRHNFLLILLICITKQPENSTPLKLESIL